MTCGTHASLSQAFLPLILSLHTQKAAHGRPGRETEKLRWPELAPCALGGRSALARARWGGDPPEEGGDPTGTEGRTGSEIRRGRSKGARAAGVARQRQQFTGPSRRYGGRRRGLGSRAPVLAVLAGGRR
jgi:hypothetical protein